MKSLPRNGDLLTVAPRIIWFEPAERTLADPVRFLAYLMTYGTLEDIAIVQRYLAPENFREALELAPPAIVDKRSWAYWNTVTGRYPVSHNRSREEQAITFMSKSLPCSKPEKFLSWQFGECADHDETRQLSRKVCRLP